MMIHLFNGPKRSSRFIYGFQGANHEEKMQTHIWVKVFKNGPGKIF